MKSVPGNLYRSVLMLLAAGFALSAHPMGNFSVNHYARLYFRGHGAELTYVLDLAELPTFELLGQWQVDWKDQERLTEKSAQAAREWLANVVLLQDGQPAKLRARSVSSKAVEGAGGLPILRIAITADAPLRAGTVTYEDRNFAGRAGWKEIVVDHAEGITLESPFQTGKDLSKGLTEYPTDPGITPPQDVAARIAWMPPVTFKAPAGPSVAPTRAGFAAPKPSAPATVGGTFSERQPAAPGTVVRGDFLSRLLKQRQIGWGMILIGVLTACGLGAMHAMSPGHGKTIVAAYLVGSRGTLKHAGLLGLVVTFTHTFTVFLLGLGVLFFQQYVVPEKIVPVLGAISGLSIVGVGAMLLWRRARALAGADHGHSHGHSHDHAHGDTHGHTHSHPHGHTHSHGGHTHTHEIPEQVTLGSLIALGVSGGLVPCPSALILMLSAIALGHPGLGLVLLIGFSAGLAVVLMGIGMLAIYAKHLLPDPKQTAGRPVFRLIPVFSAVVVICLGMAMTAVSAGWVQPLRFLS